MPFSRNIAPMDKNKDLSRGSGQAFELAYAVIRIAGYSRSRVFAEELRSSAFSILRAFAESDFGRVSSLAVCIEHQLRLGEEMGEVHSANMDLLIPYIRAFAEARDSAREVKLNIPVPRIDIHDKDRPINKESLSSAKEIKSPKAQASNGNSREELVSTNKERQSNILSIIRQVQGCRLKDIQERLPGVSERTIRYDIGTLIEKGEVERIGAGGPYSYYKMKTALPSEEGTIASLPRTAEINGQFIVPL